MASLDWHMANKMDPAPQHETVSTQDSRTHASSALPSISHQSCEASVAA